MSQLQQDRIQQSLLMCVSEAFVLIDPVENCFVDANPAASELLGYEHEELLTKKVTSVFHFDLPALITFTESVMEKGEGWSNEFLCRHQDDSTLEIDVSASAYHGSDKTLIIIQLRDKQKLIRMQEHSDANDYVRRGISEWKRVERIFVDIERENQLLLRAVGEGIYGVNANGKTTFVNPAAERMLGWQADELVGRDIHSMIHYHRSDGSQYPSHECPIYAAFHDGAIHQVDDEVFWRKNGTAFPVEYTSTPIEDHGRLVGAVVVFRDISKRRQAENNLRDALHEVEDLKQKLELENAYLQEEIRAEHNHKEIVGNSMAVQHLINQIEMVSPTNANVLITGESGTGKELVARAIHESSERCERPLIRVNCAAIPRDLFESEFFGHIKGAFTGTVSDRAGRFELADGGTLFLDEVGEIPLELQSKLLRVIQEGQFERIGENKTRHVDVRIIAATNRNLGEEVKRQQFREDLYFRLNVFPIESIPLRDRRDDIALLASHFLKRSLKKINKSDVRMTQSDIKLLKLYDWPGNIRELENVIERAVILSRNGRLVFELPQARQPQSANDWHTKEDKEERVIKTRKQLHLEERNNIISALQQTHGKVFGDDGAAQLLQMRPTTLTSKIKRHGIDRNQFKVTV